ncbi:uncharacterized protein LOC119577547 [Penaeus monodon]|uniref:uncharacterized protein LOC119577547 n=1 Tax=Penaeus monodon TaxID=6687 RepID=UPI0018A7CC7B|nr:uncharacterized protein LOC119577547 [Penaeus monodon]
MRISRSKTEYLTTDIDGDQLATLKLVGENLKRVRTFKYLGSVVDEMDKEVHFRIQSGWNNWRVSGVLCDIGVPIRLKEAAPLKKLEEKKLDVAEMKMLSWMVGFTRTTSEVQWK